MAKEARFDMRMPADLVDIIKKLAAADDRSVAKYVERVLRQHVESQQREGRCPAKRPPKPS